MIDLRFQPMTKLPAKQGRPDRNGKLWFLRSPFGKTVGAGYDDLERELRLLEATDIVVESGHSKADIRNDGWPKSASRPEHPCVRLYFKCKHGRLRYECAVFEDWQANLRAIGLWLQRQRLAIEEWGIGQGGEAYRGFAQLPGGNGTGAMIGLEWASKEDAARFLLQVEGKGYTPDEVEGVVVDPAGTYREAARKAHPDAGGSDALMSKVNRARDFIAGAGT